MAKIKWKKLKKNDRVFQQGFIISSPNRFKDERKNQDNNKKELLFMEPFNEKEPEDQFKAPNGVGEIICPSPTFKLMRP